MDQLYSISIRDVATMVVCATIFPLMHFHTPPYWYSSNTPPHFLSKGKIIKSIRENYTENLFVLHGSLPQPFSPNPGFYGEYFL